MKTNNNIPAYRFQGYTDAWELRKLGEVVYRSNLTSSSKDLPRLEFEDINSGLGTLNKDISQKVDDRKGLEFNEGDVLFGKLRPYLKNWWYAEFKGIALGDFWNLKSDLWHSCFLYTYIQSNSFQLVANDTSGTKMPRSDWNLVAESIAKFPSLPEQEAIGTFFSTLDRQITLHQRKLDTLKEQKKTYLKLLFPAKGQTKPALRFQGFEDDWEIKRISDIGDIVTGNTPSTSNEDYYSKEGMMWVTPTDIDGLIITDTNKKLSPEGEKVSRIVPANSILVTCIASIGKNTLLLEAGSFNQQINAVVPNQSLYYPYFLLTQSYFWSESMKRIAPAATMQIINKNEFSNITVPLPSVPEQEAIGTFFQTLDQEITQVEVKLASLKEMKKTLLRKLFV
ncbi:TPA: restriction endonuclease subunit S [Streptococcus suis]|nr:restriction endonuclease subunit S [Streptococcus suis]